MSLVEQPEQRLRDQREPVVICHAVELGVQRHQLLLQLGADEEALLQHGAGARGHGFLRARGGECVFAAVYAHRVGVGLGRVRNDGAHEMVLHAGEPTVRHRVELLDELGLVEVQLVIREVTVVLLLEPDGRAAEGEAVHLEHGTLDRRIRSLDLCVRMNLVRRATLVVDGVLEADGEHAALENEGLGDRDALAVGPGERHAQLLLPGLEAVLVGGAAEDGEVRRRGLIGRTAQARGQHIVS